MFGLQWMCALLSFARLYRRQKWQLIKTRCPFSTTTMFWHHELTSEWCVGKLLNNIPWQRWWPASWQGEFHNWERRQGEWAAEASGTIVGEKTLLRDSILWSSHFYCCLVQYFLASLQKTFFERFSSSLERERGDCSSALGWDQRFYLFSRAI